MAIESLANISITPVPSTGETVPSGSTLPYDYLTQEDNEASANKISVFESTDSNGYATTVDGTGAFISPTGFSTAPASLSISTFESWTSGQQVQYMLAQGATPGTTVDIGGDTAIISANKSGVIIVNNVQLAGASESESFADMSAADQSAVAATSYFSNVLSVQLGLTNGATALASLNADFGSAAASVTNGPAYSSATGNGMSSADMAVFLNEITLLSNQVNAQVVYDPTQIATDLSSIMARYTLVSDFSQQRSPSTSTNNGLTVGLVSTDGNAAISNTYAQLMTQESQILAVSEAANNLAASGALPGSSQQLDAPDLVFAYQLDANLSAQAVTNADTEELEALNALLQTYAAMQNLVSQTEEPFDLSNVSQSLALTGTASTISASSLPSADLATLSIFEDVLGTGTHPLESLFGITKPTLDMVYNGVTHGVTNQLNFYDKNTWDQFATELSNTVDQLNQQSQILQNTISSETQQANQEFQLGQNALNNMYDVIQQIGQTMNS